MTTVEFGSLFEFIRNGMSVRQDKSGEGLPITRIETISEAVVNSTRVGYAGLEENDCNGWLLQPGDILFSHINSVEHIGKCAVYEGTPEKLVHGMNLLCLRPDKSKLTPQFGKYLIRSSAFRTRLFNYVNKAVNQASVSIGNLKPIEVSVPPVPEQKRIAAILDKADSIRRKRQEGVRLTEELLRSVFLEMFGDPVTNPKGWNTGILGDVIFSAKDGPHISPEYSIDGIPFLSARHVKPGRIEWNDLKHITLEEAKVHWRKCKPEIGDILYTKGGTTGVAAVFDSEVEIAVWVHIALLKLNHNKVNPYWLENMLNSKYCYDQSQRYTHGITNQDLGLKRMVNIEIYIPPLSEQNKFHSAVKKIKNLASMNASYSVNAEHVFNSLLQSAFNGKSWGAQH